MRRYWDLEAQTHTQKPLPVPKFKNLITCIEIIPTSSYFSEHNHKKNTNDYFYYQTLGSQYSKNLEIVFN